MLPGHEKADIVSIYRCEQGIYILPMVTEACFHMVIGICSLQLRDLVSAVLSRFRFKHQRGVNFPLQFS